MRCARRRIQQVERLENQHPQSPEVGLLRTYIEWLLAVPWGVETEDNVDLDARRRRPR